MPLDPSTLRLSVCPSCGFPSWLWPGDAETCRQCEAGAVLEFDPTGPTWAEKPEAVALWLGI
jgi:hypothetical protein